MIVCGRLVYVCVIRHRIDKNRGLDISPIDIFVYIACVLEIGTMAFALRDDMLLFVCSMIA